MDILKKRIHDLRVDADMKQSDLCDALNISQSAVSAYECGREPPLDVIFAYAAFFNVTVEYLLGLTNEKTPPAQPLDKALHAMQAAAEAAGDSAFSRSDVARLAAAFVAYYKAGAPAGGVPMGCAVKFIDAMVRMLEAAAGRDAAALLLACNDTARAGMDASAALVLTADAGQEKPEK